MLLRIRSVAILLFAGVSLNDKLLCSHLIGTANICDQMKVGYVLTYRSESLDTFVVFPSHYNTRIIEQVTYIFFRITFTTHNLNKKVPLYISSYWQTA